MTNEKKWSSYPEKMLKVINQGESMTKYISPYASDEGEDHTNPWHITIEQGENMTNEIPEVPEKYIVFAENKIQEVITLLELLKKDIRSPEKKQQIAALLLMRKIMKFLEIGETQ